MKGQGGKVRREREMNGKEGERSMVKERVLVGDKKEKQKTFWRTVTISSATPDIDVVAVPVILTQHISS